MDISHVKKAISSAILSLRAELQFRQQLARNDKQYTYIKPANKYAANGSTFT